MCRKQPGRRCPRHCAQNLSRAVAAWQNIDAPLDGVASGPREAARDEVLLASTDVDATGSGRRELWDRLSELEGRRGAASDQRRRSLVTRLVAAQALVDEWRRQDQLMPPALPAGASAQERSLRRAVGKARGQSARYAVQLLLHRNNPEAVHRWAQRHRESMESALTLHGRLRAEQAGGRPNRQFLSDKELGELRSAGPAGGYLVVESHRRAVRAEAPDAFTATTPLPTGSAAAAIAAAAAGNAAVGSPVAADGDGAPAPAPVAARAVCPASAASAPAGAPPAGSARPAGRAGRQRNRFLDTRRQELRELRQVIARSKALDAKLRDNGGDGIEVGGLLMLDYFTANLG